MSNNKEVMIDGVAYVPKTASQPAQNTEGLPFVIVRSSQSGCHAGYLKSEDGNTVNLTNSIRLWYWDGAFTLSQLAEQGVSSPENCKFAMPVQDHTVYGCCEKLQATKASRISIEGVTPCLK